MYTQARLSQRKSNLLISIVLPAYNEEENVAIVAGEIQNILRELPYMYEIIIVDDGSSDGTSKELQRLSQNNSHLFYISLSRNFGHQHALKAGIDYAKGDCIITMDCDMQHPPALIPEMIQKWLEGYDVVYTRRKETARISFFKKITSALFYSVLNKLSSIHIEKGTADFRLIDQKVADVLLRLQETDLFLRGLISWMGFKQFAIDYSAAERLYGKSKYSLSKMISLSVKGITSFSVRPLYMAIYLGFFCMSLAMLYVPFALYDYFTHHVVSGWTSIIMTIVFFGGINLVVLGVIGIYIGKLFVQSKQRPLYIVSATNIPSPVAVRRVETFNEPAGTIFKNSFSE